MSKPNDNQPVDDSDDEGGMPVEERKESTRPKGPMSPSGTQTGPQRDS